VDMLKYVSLAALDVITG